MNPASVQPVEATDARLLASPILQEYDAFTVVIPPQSNLWKQRVGRNRTLAQWMGFAIATVAARLLARPILQEYDASTVVEELTWIAARHILVEIAEACRREAKLFKLAGRNPASVQSVEMEAVGCC